MEIKTDEIASLLKKQLQGFQVDLDISEVGEVIMVGDGVARVNGLENVNNENLEAKRLGCSHFLENGVPQVS